MIEDYQWPYWADAPRRFVRVSSRAPALAARARAIEAFFEDRLNVHAVLLPSARSCLAQLMLFHGLGRHHTVFAPRWSATCVWNTIGHHCNPASDHPLQADMVVAVHKWGQVSRARARAGALLVEDSVDSLLTSPQTLFPNGGAHEVLSLTKILGTLGGGVILTRDAGAAQHIRLARHDGDSLARHQSFLKHLASTGKYPPRAAHLRFDHAETHNTGLEHNVLANIRQSLAAFDHRGEAIERRLQKVARHSRWRRFIPESAHQGRLPPVLPVPVSEAPRARVAHLMVRQFDFTRNTTRPAYEPAYLLPLHFGVSDAMFQRLWSALNGR